MCAHQCEANCRRKGPALGQASLLRGRGWGRRGRPLGDPYGKRMGRWGSPLWGGIGQAAGAMGESSRGAIGQAAGAEGGVLKGGHRASGWGRKGSPLGGP